jgi:hypothetical protein
VRVVLRVQALGKLDSLGFEADPKLVSIPDGIAVVTLEVRRSDAEVLLAGTILEVEGPGLIEVQVVVHHGTSVPAVPDTLAAPQPQKIGSPLVSM